MIEKIKVNKAVFIANFMPIDYVQYGPVTPDSLQLDTFRNSVNTQVNDLRIQVKAEIINVSSSIHPFVDKDGRTSVMYFAQIAYRLPSRPKE